MFWLQWNENSVINSSESGRVSLTFNCLKWYTIIFICKERKNMLFLEHRKMHIDSRASFCYIELHLFFCTRILKVIHDHLQLEWNENKLFPDHMKTHIDSRASCNVFLQASILLYILYILDWKSCWWFQIWNEYKSCLNEILDPTPSHDPAARCLISGQMRNKCHVIGKYLFCIPSIKICIIECFYDVFRPSYLISISECPKFLSIRPSYYIYFRYQNGSEIHHTEINLRWSSILSRIEKNCSPKWNV